jgi:hypothetical protein
MSRQRKNRDDKETLQVMTASSSNVRRRGGVKELAVDVLADNVRSFMDQIGNILDKTPEAISNFQFTEFTVSAEISANGKLTLLGIGGEAGATGGITFTFKRASS